LEKINNRKHKMQETVYKINLRISEKNLLQLKSHKAASLAITKDNVSHHHISNKTTSTGTPLTGTTDNPKIYKYRLGQEAGPLDLNGKTNLGKYVRMIKQSKITEGWGKCLPTEVVI
jgi:hypothetical protein